MQRLDKFLSEAGAASRREIKKLVRSGAVTVNGSPAKAPEQPVSETDVICLHGQPVEGRRIVVLMLHKPAGYLSATEDARDPTVMDLLPEKYRIWGVAPVGRLDKDTEGLLLLTNDGEFAHRVISPKYAVSKVYRATVEQPLDPDDPERFQNGLVLADGTRCLPADLRILGDFDCLVTVQEGKYHQVRRMLAAVGKPVLTLRRLSVGALKLEPGPGLGQYRELTEEELCIMFKMLGMEK